MKQRIRCALFTAILLLCSIAFAETSRGTGTGNNGPITVEVTYSDGKITDVTIESHSETSGICDKAIENIPLAIVAAGTTDVDLVTGASNTSKGIIEAVNNALSGVDTSAWKTWPGLDVYRSNELLDQYTEEANEKYASALLQYASTVTVGENGVKIQKVPADSQAYNNYVLNAENRGCTACHTIEDALYNLAIPHSVLQGCRGKSISVNTCIVCHKEIFQAKYDVKVSLQDSMHMLHYNSSNFTGNCFSCHYITEDGEYQLWDTAKYSVLAGITTESNFHGEFSFDQNVTLSAEEAFTHLSEQSDPNGLSALANDDREGYESWTLKVTGACQNKFDITLLNLDNYPTTSRILKNHCIINGFGDTMIANCNLQGIDMNELIRLAQVDSNVNYIRFHTAEREEAMWIAPIEMFDLEDNDGAMLVCGLDGDYLDARMGGPYALWWGNYNGNVYVRYITEIEFIASEEPIKSSMMGDTSSLDALQLTLSGCPQYYEGNYSEYVNCPNHAVLSAEEGTIFTLGEPVTLSGYADAYKETIRKIEFSLDGGNTWDAFETPDATKDRWVYWTYTMDNLAPGSYVLTMRCTTDTGRVSPGVTNFLFNVQ